MIPEFTDPFKDFIKQAREVAIALRSGYICTFHFFLAECLNEDTSANIRGFVFPDKDRFLQYYEAMKAIHLYYNPDFQDHVDLPLTKEAEIAIMEAFTEQLKYGHPELLPAHFFLAAIRDTGSQLNRAILPKDDLYDRLLGYYIHTGLLANPYSADDESKIMSGFYRKLKPLIEPAADDWWVQSRRIEFIRLNRDMPVYPTLSLNDDTKIALLIDSMQVKKDDPAVYAVQLSEKEGDRKVLIELTGFEAQALAAALENLSSNRPLTHRLFYDVCMNLDFQIHEIVLYAHDDVRFLSEVHLISKNKILVQEIRTPDALVLAALAHSPIYIATKLFQSLAFIPE